MELAAYQNVVEEPAESSINGKRLEMPPPSRSRDRNRNHETQALGIEINSIAIFLKRDVNAENSNTYVQSHHCDSSSPSATQTPGVSPAQPPAEHHMIRLRPPGGPLRQLAPNSGGLRRRPPHHGQPPRTSPLETRKPPSSPTTHHPPHGHATFFAPLAIHQSYIIAASVSIGPPSQHSDQSRPPLFVSAPSLDFCPAATSLL